MDDFLGSGDAGEGVRMKIASHHVRRRASPRRAARRASPPRGKPLPRKKQVPNFASQMRVAFSSIALEHRLKLAGRRADDPQHLRGRGLLLQEISRSSLSSRVFSMAMTAWAAKFLTSSICLSVNGRTSWR